MNTIQIDVLDEEISYKVDEAEDCRNKTEQEAFLLCQKHQKAICIGKTIASPSNW